MKTNRFRFVYFDQQLMPFSIIFGVELLVNKLGFSSISKTKSHNEMEGGYTGGKFEP